MNKISIELISKNIYEAIINEPMLSEQNIIPIIRSHIRMFNTSAMNDQVCGNKEAEHRIAQKTKNVEAMGEKLITQKKVICEKTKEVEYWKGVCKKGMSEKEMQVHYECINRIRLENQKPTKNKYR